VCVCVCVLNSKEMLRPRLSAKAFSLLQNNANWGDGSKEHESVISLMAAEYPDPLDDRQVFDVAERPVESLHVQNEAEEGSGLPVAIWDTRELLEDAPYKLLPASEPPNWLRDSLRRVLGWKKPRNKHELLFGWLGGSAPRVLAYLIQLLFFGSTMLLMTNVVLMDWTCVTGQGQLLMRCLSALPSLLILSLMPGIIIKFNYAISTEELTRTALLKQVVGETRRNQFVKALRSLLSLSMLFRDNENSIPQKLAVLESGSIPPRRSAEEDNLMLSKYSSEELGLLEAAFLKGVRSDNTLGAVLSDARQLEAIMLGLSLALSRTEADLLFNFMDRDGNAAIDFNEFAAVVLLPLSGPDTFTPADGQDAAENAANTLFAIIDVSNDGLVTLEEFQTILARVFPSWNPDSLVPLFREIDEDESGTINR